MSDNGFPGNYPPRRDREIQMLLMMWVEARQEWLTTRAGITHPLPQTTPEEIEASVVHQARAGARALLHRLKQFDETGE
jgi:hypothetical protein